MGVFSQSGKLMTKNHHTKGSQRADDREQEKGNFENMLHFGSFSLGIRGGDHVGDCHGKSGGRNTVK